MGLDAIAAAILSQGGIWAALFMLAVALGSGVAIHLHGKLMTCQADRVTDAKALGEIIQANGIVLAQQTAENAARTRANEAMARAQELTALRLENMAAELSRLRDRSARGES
jgi:phosphoribosylformylglycinamidine (FGAM) synthase-like enzyme